MPRMRIEHPSICPPGKHVRHEIDSSARLTRRVFAPLGPIPAARGEDRRSLTQSRPLAVHLMTDATTNHAPPGVHLLLPCIHCQ
jgi:hypothetical protein